VICGISAATAGIWMPAPADLTAMTANSSQTASKPVIMISASARVDRAIAASAPMIRYLRL
jgi:hypothetical protein